MTDKPAPRVDATGVLFGIDASPNAPLWNGPARSFSDYTEDEIREAWKHATRVREPEPPQLYFSPQQYRDFKAACEALGIADHYEWGDDTPEQAAARKTRQR